MSAAFGVHFGSTNACLAVCKNGKPEVIANDAGDRVTAAVVAFTDHDKAVGAAAKQGLIRNAPNTVCFVKEVIGRSFDDDGVKKIAASMPVKIIDQDGCPMYDVEYKEKRAVFSPKAVTSLIYKKMMETAESHGGITDSHDAVLTIPINFSEAQKDAVCEAATDAGFNVLRVISEPVAAVLAYDIGQSECAKPMNVLVYKLGGRCLDLTVVRCVGGMYHVVSSHTDRQIGGQVVDDFIVKHFIAEFARRWKSDCGGNQRAVAKLRVAAQTCKHILSTMPSAQASIDSLYEGIDFQSTITRARFEGLCSSFLQSCLEPLTVILNDAGIAKDDIHKVVLCGGSAKLPSLQQLLRDYFVSATVLSSVPPDEVIATGAALQASILSGDDQTELNERAAANDIDCLAADILVQVEGSESFVTVLHRFTPVPVRQQKQWTLSDSQTSFCLHILQSTVDGCKPESLAKIVMKDLPAAAKVNVVFHVRSDSSLHVTCTEPSSNVMQDVTIESDNVEETSS